MGPDRGRRRSRSPRTPGSSKRWLPVDRYWAKKAENAGPNTVPDQLIGPLSGDVCKIERRKDLQSDAGMDHASLTLKGALAPICPSRAPRSSRAGRKAAQRRPDPDRGIFRTRNGAVPRALCRLPILS